MFNKSKAAPFIGDDNKSDSKAVAITNKNRQDWNDYIQYLRSKGLAGNPALDKNGYGMQVLQDYIKQNPNTSLTTNLVKPIQSDFSNYRNFALDQVKNGKAVLTNGATPDTFMSNLSQLDNWAGSLTTKHLFPKEFMVYMDSQGKQENKIDKGFATAQK